MHLKLKLSTVEDSKRQSTYVKHHSLYLTTFKCLCKASYEDALSLTSSQLLHLILLRNLNLNLNPEARFMKDYM